MTIAEHDMTRFNRRTDEAYSQLVESLQQPLSKVARVKKEQACGLRLIPEGLMFSAQARSRLPFSSSLTDTMHDYYSNGICCTEIAFMVADWRDAGCH